MMKFDLCARDFHGFLKPSARCTPAAAEGLKSDTPAAAESQDGLVAQPSLANKDLDLKAGQIDPYTKTCTRALQEIAFKCGTKVLFARERIGQGNGLSIKLLKNLLYIWLISTCHNVDPDSYVSGDGSGFIAHQKENGFVNEPNTLCPAGT
ncbi:hypothetical protein C2S52_003615 [Perilla frutescens var. hirtella]|nr:hypothetical protein C2S52_003615 [Perilla frutescens var. hirtella]